MNGPIHGNSESRYAETCFIRWTGRNGQQQPEGMTEVQTKRNPAEAPHPAGSSKRESKHDGSYRNIQASTTSAAKSDRESQHCGGVMRRSSLWPAPVFQADENWRALSRDEQWLFKELWHSSTHDAAGFDTLQLGRLCDAATPRATEGEMRSILDSLVGRGWIGVDYSTYETLLVPWIAIDASTQVNQYVSACRSIAAVVSVSLRNLAWEQVRSIHPPPVKLDVLKPHVADDNQRKQQTAFDDLYVVMKTLPKPFPKGSGTLAAGNSLGTLVEGSDIDKDDGLDGGIHPPPPTEPSTCTQCFERPSDGDHWWPGLCLPCIQAKQVRANAGYGE
ncbi:hypothetical protein ACTXG7_02335 [Mycolicibacterium sp. Dal123E01]|uniref:hypothetical protein n=1 Tax=Mycolicibacterium sp. Dal123E01 TaxID=3457578 RepID=UPI00403EF24B